MGAFAELFGIRPWEYWNLTQRETAQLESYVHERNEQMREANRK